MFWARYVLPAVLLLGIFGVTLWTSGALRWLNMAMSFLIQQRRREQRALLVLRWKLAMLRALARAIGETETRIAEIER